MSPAKALFKSLDDESGLTTPVLNGKLHGCPWRVLYNMNA
jgi:hypothetical protein